MDLAKIEAYTGPITTPRLVIACSVIYLLAFGPSISRIFGHSKITYFHSKKSLQLTLKDGTKTTFDKFCKSVIPPCKLNPFLFNGDLQTCWTAVVDTPIPVFYRRWTFEQEDPNFAGTYTIDFVTKAYEKKGDESLPPRTTFYTQQEFDNIGSNDTRPMLVTLHGLSGGSHEVYLREVLHKLVNGEGGWEACVVNSRGCAQSKITTPMLYNARTTWDVRQTVKWLRKTFPNRPLFGCGFSLGANMMTCYVGEEGEKCELKAVVVLSSPWNLEIGDKALQRSRMGRSVYSKAMGRSLRALFEIHIEQLSKNPIDIDGLRKSQSLHEFDHYVQRPCFGYPTVGAYYRDAASSDALLNIRVPFLAINAEDDPIASHEALPYEEMQETPYGVLCATELGGHLSWFKLGGGRWFADAAAIWLRKMATEVDLDSLPRPIHTSTDGMANGVAKEHIKQTGKPIFDPMRRNWHTPAD